MGTYVNPGNDEFEGYVKDSIFVDKTDLIRITNSVIGLSRRKRIVVSRPRRFGKTMAVSMLKAYYSCGCDSRDLFHGLAIENDPSFEEHLNKHNVISMDIQGRYLYAKKNNRLDDFSSYLSETVNAELVKLYPDEVQGDMSNLTQSILNIHSTLGTKFMFLFDEWDIIYRDEKFNKKLKKEFTEFLKGLFKDAEMSACIEFVYMTGILPVPKEETQSGLNNFREYTMLRPGKFSKYFGFTEPEVENLCWKYHMSLQEMKEWYEGYQFGSVGSVYCPASVVEALDEQEAGNYWQKTGAASELLALTNSVDPQFQETVRDLLAGSSVKVNVTSPKTKDSILTALVHFGYLAYQDGKVRIPNQEVAGEFFNALGESENNPACEVMARSADLLDKTISGDEEEVARILEENHDLYSSVLTYNQENDLACIILLSYKECVQENYTLVREFPAGKGFADIVFLPRRSDDIPIVIELKWDQTADTAIRQIKERRYAARFHGSVLLVGVSYEKDPDKPGHKKHTCIIEQVTVP